MASLIMLSFLMLTVIMLTVIMLTVIVLSVFMLSVIMLRVMARNFNKLDPWSRLDTLSQTLDKKCLKLNFKIKIKI
jgi:hypothetical protein